MSRRCHSSEAGFSLIEIMIVIVLLSIMATGTTMAIGALTRSRLRGGCMRVVAASRAAYSRAVVHGSSVRIVLNFDDHTIGIEEAHGRITLARQDDERRGRRDESQEDGAAVDPWAAAEARLEQEFQPDLGRSPFGPILGTNGDALRNFQPRPIAQGVRLVSLVTPHESEPRFEGRGAIYFFPGGLGEHAIVQLADARDTVYSVEISALTGRGSVHSEAYEAIEIMDEDGEEDRLRDPG